MTLEGTILPAVEYSPLAGSRMRPLKICQLSTEARRPCIESTGQPIEFVVPVRRLHAVTVAEDEMIEPEHVVTPRSWQHRELPCHQRQRRTEANQRLTTKASLDDALAGTTFSRLPPHSTRNTFINLERSPRKLISAGGQLFVVDNPSLKQQLTSLDNEPSAVVGSEKRSFLHDSFSLGGERAARAAAIADFMSGK